MAALREVKVDILGAHGTNLGHIRIALLPSAFANSVPSPILDLRGVSERDHALEPVQLLEGFEYRYEIRCDLGSDPVSTDRPEVFAPDDTTGRSGRLRPGLFTGSMRVRIFCSGAEVGTGALEVRARKLDYLTDYRCMLSSVADTATEAVMERFGTAEAKFSPAERGDPLTLYQRFAFIDSLFSNEGFQAALRHVVAKPYESWEPVEEIRRPGQGLRPRSRLSQELFRARARVPWPSGPPGLSLPASVQDRRTESTIDNLPNQFVKFALKQWRDTVQRLHDAMPLDDPSAPIQRGSRESEEFLGKVDAVLAEELFREVGDLTQFPSGNQVLQKREGYRDILRAYVQFEVAAQLSWSGSEEVFRAGQRNVATLYEYWCYIQVARLLAGLCQIEFRLGDLLEESSDGIGLSLRKGQRTLLSGTASRLGRRLDVEMWYNKGFSAIQGRESSWSPGTSLKGSWTVGMRPDISIRISADPGMLEHCDPIWVHFDAKYRIERIDELIKGFPEDIHTDASLSGQAAASTVKREDLLRMHAYHDAIRLSAGAYVLYPGDNAWRRHAYKEILPGLGAFKLRPHAGAEAEGTNELRAFLEEVLLHAAQQASQHERMRFWTNKVYESRSLAPRSGATGFLRQPPADTQVLVGFVKSKEHREWIHRTGLYNLRGDDRHGSIAVELLVCDFLMLRGESLSDELELWQIERTIEALDASDLIELGYPDPRGKKYYCVRLIAQIPRTRYSELDGGLVAAAIRRASPDAPFGAPVILPWATFSRDVT